MRTRTRAQSARALWVCLEPRFAMSASSSRLDAEEYLDRFGITAYMKDVLTLLLENRPNEPVEFMSKYFRTVSQGTSPLLRACRYIQLAGPDQSAFVDNMVAAYVALDSRRGASGVTGAEVLRLLRLLCADGPIDVSRSLLLLLDRTEGEPMSFDHFAAAVRGALYYEDFFRRTSAFFAVCDPSGSGAVPRSMLVLATSAVGGDFDAAGINAALKHEQARDRFPDDPAASADAAGSPPSPAARADLHRLQREVQWEVTRVAGVDGRSVAPSSPTSKSPASFGAASATSPPSTVKLDEFLLAMFAASVSGMRSAAEAVTAAKPRDGGVGAKASTAVRGSSSNRASPSSGTSGIGTAKGWPMDDVFRR